MERLDSDLLVVTGAAAVLSLLAFLFYLQRSQILLYGDAVAHVNIARRVFDSQTPGLLQLGTVWLPLPHLLMIPFLVSKSMWQSGAGGSIPSMVAYVFGTLGIFRLTRGVLQRDVRTRAAARLAAYAAALVYAGNPNLLYLQSTAMTEPVYLAFFVWALVYFAEFLQEINVAAEDGAGDRLNKSLFRCALFLAAAELTRYDGWFLAAALGVTVLVLMGKRRNDTAFRRTCLKFLLWIAIAPAVWLAYNAFVYGDALEFARGPYSAKAIERRTATPGSAPHPGTDHVFVAASYFLKTGELNMAPANWGRMWIALALAALVFILGRVQTCGSLLFLGIPLLFYALSVAYGGVPIFLPLWWPFSWYNLRYGLQLLPFFAVSAGVIVAALPQLAESLGARPGAGLFHATARCAGCAIVLALTAFSYVSVWKVQPLCFKEAWINSRAKLSFESAVARGLRFLPTDATYLMYLGDHVGAFQHAGIPLRQVVNEGNHRPWKKPSDPEGLWERALADPARYVDFVIAFDGDAVDQAVDKSRLTLLNEIHTTGQPGARIYATRALNQSR